MFDYRTFAHLAAPRSVGHLNARVLPGAVILVECDLLVAWFEAGVATFLESQSGKNFLQVFNSL